MSLLLIRSFGDALSNSASQLSKRATYNLNDPDQYDQYYSPWSRKIIIVYTIIIFAVAGLSLLGGLVAAVVWYFQRERRKKLYGPMAQHYQQRGFGTTGVMIGHNGALYVPQVIYVPFGGQPGMPPPPPGSMVGAPTPMQYLQNNASQPQLQPLNTSVAYTRSFGSGHGPGSGTNNGPNGAGDVAAGLNERDIAGPTSPIRDFNGATSHDPFASPRVHPSAHLQPQPDLNVDQGGNVDTNAHSITEVHGHGVQEQQMTERREGGATGVNNSLSFYAVPMGSHPNLAGSRP